MSKNGGGVPDFSLTSRETPKSNVEAQKFVYHGRVSPGEKAAGERRDPLSHTDGECFLRKRAAGWAKEKQPCGEREAGRRRARARAVIMQAVHTCNRPPEGIPLVFGVRKWRAWIDDMRVRCDASFSGPGSLVACRPRRRPRASRTRGRYLGPEGCPLRRRGVTWGLRKDPECQHYSSKHQWSVGRLGTGISWLVAPATGQKRGIFVGRWIMRTIC